MPQRQREQKVPKRPGPRKPQRGLGMAIRQLRDEAGLKQIALAKRSGISASWLSRIESGDYDPTWGDMRKVAAGLGVPLEIVVRRAEELESEETPDGE